MKRIILITGIMILGAISCGTSTMITGSWHKLNASANGYQNIFVAALTNNIPAKQAVENGIQQHLQEKGLTVEKSMDVFPPTLSKQTDQQKDLVLGAIQQSGADGILTIALLKTETESHYEPGGDYWDPGLRFGYYNHFWSYYSNWYPYVYSPGYYDQDKVYYIETNLYDAHNEQLIWAAQSKTYNPTDIESFLKGYLSVICKQMVKDGVLTPQGNRVNSPGNSSTR